MNVAPDFIRQQMLVHTKPTATVLAVDDKPDNLAFISSLLSEHYRVVISDNGPQALRIANSSQPPDLILLDVAMPGMDGYEVCRQLKAQTSTRGIPVIFLAIDTLVEDEQRGLALGAADYITPPVHPAILHARVQTHLSIKASNDFLLDKISYLERTLAQRTAELRDIQDATVLAMGALTEMHDTETGQHTRRTQLYVRALAEKLRRHPRFCSVLDNDQMIDMLYKSAPLHDIGKIGIPDNILLKPGKLTVEEFEIMKTHTTLGRNAIEKIERRIGMQLDFLAVAKEIAYGHQEKWDGSGYPQGLAGEAIPISARLMALADMYDALIYRRVYKPAFPHEQACATISKGRGTHFDPAVVDAFIDIAEEFHTIALHNADEE
ncbi:MAG TPA: two-component system response regulator [Burkholderiaceae bacterium]